MMLSLMIFLYLAVAVLNFRYTGYVAQRSILGDHDCAYQTSCICSNCGNDYFSHTLYYGRGCKDGAYHHKSRYLVAAVAALAWPITDTIWLGLNVNKKLGFSGKFFTEPPMIKTTSEKILSIEDNVRRLNSETDEMLRELERMK